MTVVPVLASAWGGGGGGQLEGGGVFLVRAQKDHKGPAVDHGPWVFQGSLGRSEKQRLLGPN